MRQFKYILIIPIVLVLIFQSCDNRKISNVEIGSDVDSLINLVQVTYCNGAEGMKAIEDLLAMSRERGLVDVESYALEFKAGTLVNYGRYEELDNLVDSLESRPELIDGFIESYYFILYTQVMSNINRARYKIALQQAKKLYDVSRKSETYEEDLERVKDLVLDKTYLTETPISVSCRLSALRCLATAYQSVKRPDEAIGYINEGLEITDANPVFFSSERIDLMTELISATYRIEKKGFRKLTGDELLSQEESDSIKTLTILKSFTQDIKRQAEVNGETRFNYIFYEIFQRLRFIDVYCDINDRDRAHHHYLRLMEITDGYSEANTMLGFGGYKTLAKYHTYMGEEQEAARCLDSLEVMQKNSVQALDLYKLRFEALKNKPFDKRGFSLAERIIELADSINDERLNSSIEEVSVMMGIDKYEQKAYELSEQKRTWIFIAIIAVLVTAIFMVVVEVRRGNERRRMLAEQKKNLEDEVVRQTAELRQKNRDITASINYAQKIQEAILPDIEKYVKHGISGAFSLYRPCEIVSGDFYWSTTHGDDLIIVCADCTGHGVPGALMSMIGTTVLNEICSHDYLPEPDDILENLDKQIIDVLSRKADTEVRDGMDVSVMAYNTETKELRVSSARSTVVLFKGDECIEVAKVRRSIGDRETKSHERKFVSNKYTVSNGDVIYMATDGIMDQFGGQELFGSEGVRLSQKRFIDILKTIKDNDMEIQSQMISEQLDQWRGTCPQIDDITILGVRF